MLLKQKVIRIVETALDRIGPRPADLAVRLEYAREEKFGDYACTIAMDKRWRDAYAAVDESLAAPRKFAEALAKGLLAPDLAQAFAKVEVAGPGFINLTLSSFLLGACVSGARRAGEAYGRSDAANSRKILLEFVSANPTGPLNVVSARAAALGDACANLLEAAGAEVRREYYVNDYGNQVNLLGRSCLLRFLETRGVKAKFAEKTNDHVIYEKGPGLPFPAEGYHGEYVKDVALALAEDFPNLHPAPAKLAALKKMSARDDAPEDWINREGLAALEEDWGRVASTFLLASHRLDLEEFRVRFDTFYSERSLHENGRVLAVRDRLGPYVYGEDGKELFRSTEFGDDKDRVIVREDGRPTYLLADIAYHATKIERGFREAIDIWGPDHHGYIARLAGAMRALGYDGFQVKIAQQVNLLDGGEPVVMSKRTGRFITMETLIEEIPVDVVRYFFVMRSFDSHLDFDFSEARDTSEKNPYYYVAYAHARIRSIFRKTDERGLVPAAIEDEFLGNLELTAERRRLAWLAARFPEEVADAAREMEPHRLVTFLYQLATALSKFYGPRENRVVDQDPITAGRLLAILDAVAICLKNGLGLLGMDAPERMEREAAAEAGADDPDAN